VGEIIRIGVDTSKAVFQLHGVNRTEEVVLRRKLRRSEVLEFFAKLGPTVVVLEACAASHHWGRELEKLGHEARLIPPQYSKPYVKRNKNDAADAAGLCEAGSRPHMRYVPIKRAEEQADLMLTSTRDLLVPPSAATLPSSAWWRPRGWTRSSRCWSGSWRIGTCRSGRASCSRS
jgi:transposase